jgi:hypothetical protein
LIDTSPCTGKQHKKTKKRKKRIIGERWPQYTFCQ